MAPYGSTKGSYDPTSGNYGSTCYSSKPVQKLTPAEALRGISIVDVRRQGDIVEVTTYSGDKFLVDRLDFEYMDQSGRLDRERKMYQARVMGDFTSYTYAVGIDLAQQPQQAPTTNPAKPKSPEKNSLKRVYYHNRLRKKS